MSDQNVCRLYLITPPQIPDLGLFSKIFRDALSERDVACVQLRLKTDDGCVESDNSIISAANILMPIAREYDVAFLINDRPDLAKQVGADGVHIGQSDVSYAEARAFLGEEASIGVTCHNSRHLALEAGESGADYVAFGAFYPTSTKVPPSYADPSVLSWWQDVTTVPCVAIGGINAENCVPLVEAGADFLAVSSAVWEHQDGAKAGVEAMHLAISTIETKR